MLLDDFLLAAEREVTGVKIVDVVRQYHPQRNLRSRAVEGRAQYPRVGRAPSAALFLGGNNQRSRLHVVRVNNIRAINPDVSGANPVRTPARDGHNGTTAQFFWHV